MKDYTLAHPRMKQQYTHQDMVAAFNAGKSQYEFQDWFNEFTPEMYKPNAPLDTYFDLKQGLPKEQSAYEGTWDGTVKQF